MSSRSIERATGAGLPMAMAVLAGLLGLQTTTVAQSPAQQLIGDAVAAMGGRDRVMTVKTLMLEGGGHDFQVDQEFAYDELGSQFLVYQLRDYKRSYDLANGRGRFEQVREAQSTIFNGQRPQRTVQGLDGDIAFNVGENGTATRAFRGGGPTGRVSASSSYLDASGARAERDAEQCADPGHRAAR